ncbi:phosphoglycerate mutase [Blastomonas aquatica]|uniref:Phosphoglycerate mutase n=1 Tax=Blastomonas aquatica TaxID=1510276 RepID=A0ABQ1JP61_9SPHN|nr:phosphoglycerate mutase [Blastomonas aquatica]
MLLVRHTQVARAWQGRCYGQSDMGLSREGAVHMRALAPELAAWNPEIILHSGLRRARILAEAVATLVGVPARADPQWQERDFGSWEGRSWDAIYRATGNAMDGMIDAPGHFRPGGGETTMELARRALTGFDTLPAGRVLVITHGGPIAAILGMRQGLAAREWPGLVPQLGGIVEIDRSPAAN